MVVLFVPARLLGHTSRPGATGTGRQSPFATDLFLSIGSTGSKQTLNGLFYVYQPELFSPGIPGLRDDKFLNQFIRTKKAEIPCSTML